MPFTYMEILKCTENLFSCRCVKPVKSVSPTWPGPFLLARWLAPAVLHMVLREKLL